MPMARAHVIISGRVHGVGFRWSTQTQARAQGVGGWVRNRSGGTVEAVFEGDKERVDAMVEWCRRGPVMASVENVEVRWLDPIGDPPEFRIR